ncbi:MAG: hypothetical protein OEQ13_07030 [Acidobacteriota bacterium]|nr:hypothetical protein [Acidobacteriota bacterium]
MIAARFTPLTCPSCGRDLVGREADCLAFCPDCSGCWRCDRDGLSDIPVRTVLVDGAPSSASLPLPCWRRGNVVQPAFLSARPLWLARAISELAATWRFVPGLAAPPPLGACIPPESIEAASRLARLRPPAPHDRLELIVVPCSRLGRRWHLPGSSPGGLYPDDVLEARWLERRG